MMTAFRHILVATDFGEPAGQALELAIDIASKLESKITLIHVYAIPVVDYAHGFYWPVDDLERASRKMLDEKVEAAKQRYPRIEGLLAFGEAWSHVLEAAKTRKVDAIFVGTHGRRWLSKMFLGSVADKLVRLSPIPVVVVPSNRSGAGDADRVGTDTE